LEKTMTQKHDPNSAAENRDPLPAGESTEAAGSEEGLRKAAPPEGEAAAVMEPPAGIGGPPAGESPAADGAPDEPIAEGGGEAFSFALDGGATETGAGAAEPAAPALESNGHTGRLGRAGAHEEGPVTRPLAGPAVGVEPLGGGAGGDESLDPNKRMRFGIKRKTDAAVLEGPKVVEEHFPYNQTVLWQPVAQGAKAGAGKGDGTPPVSVVVTQEVLLQVNRHVAQTLDHEVGGFLIGDHCRCPESGREFIMIDQYSPAKFTEATEVSLAFTVDAWAHMNAELGGKFRGKLCVGWYHSHPKMDVFLSRYDMEIQNERFQHPWMTALVLEPEKHRGGFFCWRGGTVNPNEPVEFYELLDRKTRDSVVAWTNYVGIDTVTHQKPQMMKVNTLTASARDAADPAQRHNAAGAVPPGPVAAAAAAAAAAAGAPAVVAPPARRGTSKAVFWAIIAAAAVLGLGAVWGITKLRVASSTSGDANASADAKAAEANEVVEVPKLRIDREKTWYEAIDGNPELLGVHIPVDNMPGEVFVKLDGHDVEMDEVQPVEGSQTRQEIVASINFANRVAEMRRTRQPFKLFIEVTDKALLENNSNVVAIWINPEKLGVNSADKPAASGPIFSEKTEEVKKNEGTVRKTRREILAASRAAKAAASAKGKSRTNASGQKAKTPTAPQGQGTDPASVVESPTGATKKTKKGTDDEFAPPPEVAPVDRNVATTGAVKPPCSAIKNMTLRARAKATKKCI
jgi:proteasome lid subunit RPN8/RPN11